MSIDISRINNNQCIHNVQRGVAAFKSNPMPNDSVKLSSKKKELSDGAKIGIALGIVSAIALGVELIKYKGKHFKKLQEKIKGKAVKSEGENLAENTKKIGDNPKTTTPTAISCVADFKNMNEAKAYFDRIGVKTVFKSGSERHLADLNNIKNDLILLEKNGVAMPKPESIIVSDWHNAEELKQIFRPLNIEERQATICQRGSGYWGTVTKGSDNKCHVLINSSFGGNYGRFIHEMGHIHQDYLNSSFWHSKGLGDKEFLNKQMEILGLSDIGLHSEFLNSISENYNECAKSIFRLFHLNNVSSDAKVRIRRLFPEINDRDFEKVFSIMGSDGKTYYINAKKMVDRMASESGVYAPTKAWENVAEMFQGLNQGKEYSDLAMLMYDINGGGRVPNLIIKGKKYDDYIESLYYNTDLIKQLRESIKVRKAV